MTDDKLISLSSSSTSIKPDSRNTSKKSSNATEASDLISLTSNEDVDKNDLISSKTKDDGNSHNYDASSQIDLVKDTLLIEGLEELTSQDDRQSPRPPTVDHDAQTSRRPTVSRAECRYGYHFPSSPTSSMISELAKQVESAQKKPLQANKNDPSIVLSENAKKTQLARLHEMFPTATEPIIEQIMQIYNGREGLIKAALISLGFKRAVGPADRQANVQNAILLMMAKPSSKRLFDKLSGYFPDRDENTIKRLMYDLKEVEHEIISALVTSSPSASLMQRRRRGDDQKTKSEFLDRRSRDRERDKNAAIMKLRFLKTLFPSCEEIHLYNLLYCHDLNAQTVILELEKQGHTPVNINQLLASRKTQAQQAKVKQQASRAAKSKPPGPNIVDMHRSRAKQPLNEAKFKSLKETVAQRHNQPNRQRITTATATATESVADNKKRDRAEDGHKDQDQGVEQPEDLLSHKSEQLDNVESKVIPDRVIELALQAAQNDENLAKELLDDFDRLDESKYTQRLDLNLKQDQQVVLYPCKSVQKGECGNDIVSFEVCQHVSIPWEIVHCQTAIALIKKDACTFTGDDLEHQRPTYRLGPIENLAKGSIFAAIEQHVTSRKGANYFLSVGSNYKELCRSADRQQPKELARGPNGQLRASYNGLSSQRRGHDKNLVQRIHPFFERSKGKPKPFYCSNR